MLEISSLWPVGWIWPVDVGLQWHSAAGWVGCGPPCAVGGTSANCRYPPLSWDVLFWPPSRKGCLLLSNGVQ